MMLSAIARRAIRLVGLSSISSGILLYSSQTSRVPFTVAMCDEKTRNNDDSTQSTSLLPSEVTEYYSSSKFQKQINNRVYGDMKLLSVSVRCMLGLCHWSQARAYSFAFYMNDNHAGEFVASILGAKSTSSKKETFDLIKQINTMPSDQKIIKSSTSSQYVPLVLRLRLLHDIAGSHMAKGFERSLLHRVKAYEKEMKKSHDALPVNTTDSVPEHLSPSTAMVAVTSASPGESDVRLFLHFLTIISQPGQKSVGEGTGATSVWLKDTEFDFYRDESGVLTLLVNGEVKLVMNSSAMAWAVLDTYLGSSGHCKSQCKMEIQDSMRRMSLSLDV